MVLPPPIVELFFALRAKKIASSDGYVCMYGEQYAHVSFTCHHYEARKQRDLTRVQVACNYCAAATVTAAGAAAMLYGAGAYVRARSHLAQHCSPLQRRLSLF